MSASESLQLSVAFIGRPNGWLLGPVLGAVALELSTVLPIYGLGPRVIALPVEDDSPAWLERPAALAATVGVLVAEAGPGLDGASRLARACNASSDLVRIVLLSKDETEYRQLEAHLRTSNRDRVKLLTPRASRNSLVADVRGAIFDAWTSRLRESRKVVWMIDDRAERFVGPRGRWFALGSGVVADTAVVASVVTGDRRVSAHDIAALCAFAHRLDGMCVLVLVDNVLSSGGNGGLNIGSRLAFLLQVVAPRALIVPISSQSLDDGVLDMGDFDSEALALLLDDAGTILTSTREQRATHAWSVGYHAARFHRWCDSLLGLAGLGLAYAKSVSAPDWFPAVEEAWRPEVLLAATPAPRYEEAVQRWAELWNLQSRWSLDAQRELEHASQSASVAAILQAAVTGPSALDEWLSRCAQEAEYRGALRGMEMLNTIASQRRGRPENEWKRRLANAQRVPLPPTLLEALKGTPDDAKALIRDEVEASALVSRARARAADAGHTRRTNKIAGAFANLVEKAWELSQLPAEIE